MDTNLDTTVVIFNQIIDYILCLFILKYLLIQSLIASESGWSVRNQSFGPSVQSSFMSSHPGPTHPTYSSDHFSPPMFNILNSNNSAGHSNLINNEFQYNGHNNNESIGPASWSSTPLASSRGMSESNSWHTSFVGSNPGYQPNSCLF